MIRKDWNDKIFRTEKEKFNAIIKEIVSANENIAGKNKSLSEIESNDIIFDKSDIAPS